MRANFYMDSAARKWSKLFAVILAVATLVERTATPRPSALADPHGHYPTTPQGEQQLVYVVQTAAGQGLLSPKEFAAKYGWKNDPNKVKLPR